MRGLGWRRKEEQTSAHKKRVLASDGKGSMTRERELFFVKGRPGKHQREDLRGLDKGGKGCAARGRHIPRGRERPNP